MDLVKIGTQILMSKLGSSSADESSVESALGGLIGNGSSLDLGGLVEMAQGAGLGGLVGSWLGDGDNETPTTEQVSSIINDNDLSELSNALGKDKSSVIDALKDVLPQMVDKGSSGGSLLDSVGGLAGVASMAKKFF